MSIEIDGARLSASLSLGGSVPAPPDRPVRHAVYDCCDLVAELAEYSTPADRRDLEALLDRYDDADTDEIRTILANQARHRLTGRRARGPFG